MPTAVTRVARSEDRLTATYTVDGQSKRKQQRFTTSLTELGDVLRALGEKVVADGVVDDRPCASASAKRARPTMPNDIPSPPRTFGDVPALYVPRSTEPRVVHRTSFTHP